MAMSFAISTILKKAAPRTRSGAPAAPGDIEPDELVQEVLAGVREFTVGESQADDITVLVVRYRGAPKNAG